MSWRKFLLVPRLAGAGLRPAPAPDQAWESYWRAVQRTGPEGDVLWDGAGRQELQWWSATSRQYLDPTLPVLDVGCGNGRLSRLLAEDFPAVLGIDVSAAAVERAAHESEGRPRLAFRQLDITTDTTGETLAAELGPANAVIRGVLHVFDCERRRRAARNLARVLAPHGTLILLETHWPGDNLEYLEALGGRHGRLPSPLARLIDERLPRPSRFGPRELAQTFPATTWTTVTTGPVGITLIPTLGPDALKTIPGFGAVLRVAHRAEGNGR